MVPDVDRVVEVLVPPIRDEEWGFGSGYEVADGIVLTARHVLGDRDDARLRFRGGRPGQLDLDGRLAWGPPGLDLALLQVTKPAASASIELPSFGAPEEVAGEIPFLAIGFPLFKRMLNDDQRAIRDSQQIDGSIPLAANLKSGRLSLQTRAHPPRPLAGTNRSPWEGISGAAVFSEACLVGVVTVHRTSEGDATLTATRIADVNEIDGTDRRRFWELLGLSPDVVEIHPLGPRLHGDVVYEPITLRAPLRSVFDPLIESRTELFGGRDEEHDRVVDFIRRPAGGYLAVTAPAGFGKTAFAASIVNEQRDGFAYHFFSPIYGTDTLAEGFFLRNVVEQLAQWHDRARAIPSELHLNELRALYQHLIDATVRRTQVLVIDGLDEVRDWSLHPYLSRRLPDRLHVIVTMRDVGQDWREEYGFPAGQLEHLELRGLSRRGAAEVFRLAGGAAADLARADDALDQVMRVASRSDQQVGTADPFYVRLLAEDAAAGLVTPANLSERPQGLDRYLDGWWQEIRETHAQEARDVVGFLTVARGPIGPVDLEALVPALRDDWELDRLDDVVRSMRRLIVRSDAGLAFAHPLLPDYLATRIRTDRYRTQLLEYCRRWREHRSDYAFEHYAEHLVEAGDRAALSSIVAEEWMRAQLARTGTHRAFASDLRRVCGALETDDPADVVLEVRAGLVVASLGTLAYEIPTEALEAMAMVDEVEAALDWASLIDDDWRRGDAYRRIGDVVLEAGDRPRAIELFRLALPLGVVFDVAEGLARAGDIQGALRVIPTGNDRRHARRMLRLARVLQQADAEVEAARLVERGVAAVGDSRSPTALAAVAAELADGGHVERGTALRQRAIEIVRSFDWRSKEARLEKFSLVAGAIARFDPQEARALIMEVCTQIDLARGGLGPQPMRALLRALADVGEVQAVVNAATGKRSVEEGWAADCVQWLARAGNVDQALHIAEHSAFLESNAHAVGRAAAAVVEASEVDACWPLLEAADAYRQSEAIRQIAGVVQRRAARDEMERFLHRTLVQARTLTPPDQRAAALAALAVVAARLGDHDTSRCLAYEARDTAPISLNLESPISTLARFGLAALGQNRRQQAARLADQALALAATVANDSVVSRVCSSLLPLLLGIGSADRARALVYGVRQGRNQAQHWLAIALAENGDFHEAETAAAEIDDDDWKVEAFRACARAAASTVDSTAARRFAERARDAADSAVVEPSQRDYLLSLARSALLIAGEPDQADASASIVDDDANNPTLERAADAQAYAEDVQDFGLRAGSLADVSRMWLALGQDARAAQVRIAALDAARGLQSPLARKWLLMKMAPAFAESGDIERLVAAIEETGDAESRSEAFVALATAMGELADVDPALRIWRRGFRDGRVASRKAAYTSLADGATLLAATHDGAMINSIADTIIAIEGWWAGSP